MYPHYASFTEASRLKLLTYLIHRTAIKLHLILKLGLSCSLNKMNGLVKREEPTGLSGGSLMVFN